MQLFCDIPKFVKLICCSPVFNDGSRKELLNLQGTIPVFYKGTFF